MKVLITGASGFIGKYVVQEAVARGCEIVALTRSKPNHTSSIEYIQCNLSNEVPKLNGLGIDVVIHLAASLSGSVDEQYHSTVLGTRHLLDAIRQAGIAKIVCVSSISVVDYLHPPALCTVDEAFEVLASINTAGTYVKMKQEQEKLIASRSEIHSVILRPGLVYDSKQLLSAHAGIIKGPLCLIAKHGGEVPTVEVTGLAKAILDASEQNAANGEVIHLVDDNLPSQQEYVSALRRRGLLPSYGISVSWKLLAAFTSSLRMLFRIINQETRLPEVFQQQSFAARLKPFLYSNEKSKRLLNWLPGNRFS